MDLSWMSEKDLCDFAEQIYDDGVFSGRLAEIKGETPIEYKHSFAAKLIDSLIKNSKEADK